MPSGMTTPLTARAIIDPTGARLRILDAVRAAGSIPGAAERLRMHHSQLYRLIARLEMRAELEAAGVPVGGKYPPTRIAGLRNVVRGTAYDETQKCERRVAARPRRGA
jgi:hypothetical protein